MTKINRTRIVEKNQTILIPCWYPSSGSLFNCPLVPDLLSCTVDKTFFEEQIMSEEERWQRLIVGLRDGNTQVINEFFNEYGGMLHRLADQRLPAGVRRRIGPEDVVQSACRTFLRRAKEGE